MVNAASLAADPAWLPHRIDLAAGRVMFLGIERDTLSRTGFLAEREGEAQQAWMPLEEYAAIDVPAAPLHFIFHSGFCRSTLLVRALDIPGVSVGLNEPGILNSLVDAGEHGKRLLAPTLALLSRQRVRGEVALVKPSNYANELIEPILRASPASKVLLMTNPLSGFLVRVARKGLNGRLWGRQLFLKLHANVGRDLGLDMPAVAAMADIQAAGLAWFLQQRVFARLLRGEFKARVRLLRGDRFNQARSETLVAAAKFLGLRLGDAEARALADSQVFAVHAKAGSDFAATEAQAEAQAVSPVIEDMIATVDAWIGKLARQSGERMPVPQTLF